MPQNTPIQCAVQNSHLEPGIVHGLCLFPVVLLVVVVEAPLAVVLEGGPAPAHHDLVVDVRAHGALHLDGEGGGHLAVVVVGQVGAVRGRL